MFKLGLVSISFRRLSVDEILSAVKASGLTCVEWGSDIHAPIDDEDRLFEIAEKQGAAGIECCSYGTYFRLGKDKPEEILPYIRAAKILGTNILRLWCGTKGSAEYTENELDQLYADCAKVAKIAEENGVKVCMECHNYTVTDTKESALALMKAVNSPAFRMYYQPNQFRSEEENIALVRLLAPYIEHVHVFNWEGTNMYPLMEGVDIWKQYLAQLSGDRALLLEFMPDDRVESLPEEAKALSAIVS